MLLQKTLAFVVPASIGAAAALLMAQLVSRPSEDVGATVVEVAEPIETPREHQLDPRITGLERRFRALENARALPTQAAPEPPGEDPPVGYRTHEEEVATVTEALAERMEAFRGETVDESWSAEAWTALVTGSDVALEGLDASVFDVECRSETCVFDVESPEVSGLTTAVQRLLVHDFGIRCARTATFLQDDGERETARFVLDCGPDVHAYD